MKNQDYFQPSWGYVWGVRLLVGFAILALITIWLVGTFWSGITDRPTFIMVNTLAVLAFVISVISAFTSRETVATMRHQEFEMTLQRKTAQDQWRAMQDALERTDRLIEQNENIIEAAQRQAVAAETALQVTREHFELTERPILGIEQIDLFENENGSGYVLAKIKNTGKSPAVGVRTCIYVFLRDARDFRTGCPEPGESGIGACNGSVIPIGLYASLPSEILSAEYIERIMAKKVILFVWVEASYCKANGQENPFRLEMYVRYKPRVGFVVCSTHNDAT